jgi:outer membrane protein TolC
MKTIYIVISASLFAIASARSDDQIAANHIERWTLPDVLKITLEQNPDLKSAKANYEATSHTVGEAVSGYLPKLDFYANTQETTLPSPSGGLSSQLGMKLNYSSAVVSVNQVLFDFGKNLAQISANRSLTASSEQQSYAVRNVVTLAAQQTFYAVIAEEKLVDSAQESLVRYQETSRRTEILVKTGARPTFDLTQATVELSKAKLALINAQNVLQNSKIALLNIMGIENQRDFTLAESPTMDETQSSQIDLNKITQKALSARPELRSSEFSVDAAKHLVNREITGYLPVMSFQGWYGSYQPNYPDTLRSAWGVGLVANWNLFDGLNTTARVGEFSARLDQQEALREKQRESITAEVARDYMDLVRAESNEKVSNEALQAAIENQRLARKRYDTAVSTILELLIANGSLVDAQATAIQAKYGREIALDQLKTAVNAPLIN